MKKPTENKVRQARHAARAAGAADPVAAAKFVGTVVNFRASAHGLEYLRRIVNRELTAQVKKINNAAAKAGQSEEDFVDFYDKLQSKRQFLYHLRSCLEDAKVEP